MRRVLVVMVIAGLTPGGMAGPALASTHTHHRFIPAEPGQFSFHPMACVAFMIQVTLRLAK